jgi:hypothetical protein
MTTSCIPQAYGDGIAAVMSSGWRYRVGTKLAQTRDGFPATLSSMTTGQAQAVKSQAIRTPWGKVARVEEVSVPQRAGEQRFSTVVQLLEDERGERFVRFAYTTDGVVRRGPVTLRQRDLEKLWTALGRTPALRAALVNETGSQGSTEEPSPKARPKQAARRADAPP